MTLILELTPEQERQFEAEARQRNWDIDLFVAATAIGLGATLCEFNVKHYRAVAGLVTEQPHRR